MSMRERVGKCYQLSWQYVTRHNGWDLVHGYITDRNTGRVIDHAWAERGNIVHDPVVGKDLDKRVYYALYHAEEAATYSREEAFKMGADKGHYGPWHKIPRGKVRWWPVKDNF